MLLCSGSQGNFKRVFFLFRTGDGHSRSSVYGFHRWTPAEWKRRTHEPGEHFVALNVLYSFAGGAGVGGVMSAWSKDGVCVCAGGPGARSGSVVPPPPNRGTQYAIQLQRCHTPD